MNQIAEERNEKVLAPGAEKTEAKIHRINKKVIRAIITVSIIFAFFGVGLIDNNGYMAATAVVLLVEFIRYLIEAPAHGYIRFLTLRVKGVDLLNLSPRFWTDVFALLLIWVVYALFYNSIIRIITWFK